MQASSEQAARRRGSGLVRAAVLESALPPELALVDGQLARGAPPARLESRAAFGVAQRSGAPPACAPVREQPQRAGQFSAGARQLVGEPRRAFRVGTRQDERLLLEVARAAGEDVRGDARIVSCRSPKRGGRQQGLDDQECPAVPDLDSASARAVVGASRGMARRLLLTFCTIETCNWRIDSSQEWKMAVLEEISAAIRDSAERVGPAVVGLRARLGPWLRGRNGARDAGPGEHPQSVPR